MLYVTSGLNFTRSILYIIAHIYAFSYLLLSSRLLSASSGKNYESVICYFRLKIHKEYLMFTTYMHFLTYFYLLGNYQLR